MRKYIVTIIALLVAGVAYADITDFIIPSRGDSGSVIIAPKNAGGTLVEVVEVDENEMLINAGKTLDVGTGNFQINNTAVTASAAEINQLTGVNIGGNTSGDVVTTDGTQTLTNKTIGAGQITSGTMDAAGL